MKLRERVEAHPRLVAMVETLLAGWAVALAAGLVEVGVLAFQRVVLGRFTWVPEEFVWLTPLSWALLLTVAVVPVGVLRAAWPERVRFHHAVFLFAFLALAGLLFLHPRVHRLALGVLALGLALRVAVIIRGREARARRLLRRGAPALAATVLLLAVFQNGREAAAGWRGLRNLGASPPGAPNVLLIVLDTVRAASLGLYGYERPTTPELERFARSALVFDGAISTSSWTLPAHGSLFTGRHPHELSMGWRSPQDDRFPTLAEVFASSGYATGGFTANLYYTSRESGLARGFLHYEDYRLSREQLRLSSNLGLVIRSLRRNWVPARRLNHRKNAPLVTESFLRWLDTGPARGGRPFFAFLNYFDAHQPYRADPDLRARFEGGDRLTARYDAAIATLDRELGRLFDELRERGLLDGTIVVVTSDHGELLGEHGLTEHGNSLYLPLLHVPLLVRYPPEVAPGRAPTTVSLRDVPGSLLELAGIRPPPDFPRGRVPELSTGRGPRAAAAGGGGTSPREPRAAFAALQEGINRPPEEPVSRGDMFSLVWNRMHYILNGDGGEELYSLGPDAAETVNLAGRAAWRPVLEAMRDGVAQIRRRPGGSGVGAVPSIQAIFRRGAPPYPDTTAGPGIPAASGREGR